MKRIASYILYFTVIGVIVSSGYFIYQNTLSSCDKPLEYSVGRFDTKFGISEADFKSYIAESGSVWQKALGRKVFIYNPKASFKINLVYDERQIATLQKQKTESGLSAVEEAFNMLNSRFESLKNQYEEKSASYQAELASYDSQKAAYEKEVAYWNARGGVQPSKYESLNAARQSLNSKASNLNTEAGEVNSMGKQLSTLLEERNTKASEYNSAVEAYNKKYGSGLEFNQAEYTGKEINVYQFGNRKDLVLALTHELGHALGMNHVQNPKSIMYYITGANTTVSLTPSTEDLAELNKVCKK